MDPSMTTSISSLQQWIEDELGADVFLSLHYGPAVRRGHTFFDQIEDGVVLCSLVHKYTPELLPLSSIKRENIGALGTSTYFNSRHNFHLVLSACAQIGVDNLCAFEDLYLRRNLRHVLLCLNAIRSALPRYRDSHRSCLATETAHSPVKSVEQPTDGDGGAQDTVVMEQTKSTAIPQMQSESILARQFSWVESTILTLLEVLIFPLVLFYVLFMRPHQHSDLQPHQ